MTARSAQSGFGRAHNLAAQDRDVVPQYQNLHILRDVARARSASQPNNRTLSR
jgi:hypothetical protein